jgi:hypothetical protein
MIRILYLSQSIPGITDKNVSDILLTARRENPERGITGVLIHGGGLFMQILEGPELSTIGLYMKISADRRHSDCQIMHISPVEERLFPKWSMGVIHSDPLQFQHIAKLRERRFESVQAKEYKAAMAEFLKLLTAGAVAGVRS